ncbi:NO-inducible flavohemoprotein [Shouchella shacheensis]|uniref:NO-inducible flavohemoprotein n=1 Tax=Shouchella shacheensis TaxID=1649580 RepID=UPI00073FD75B|nr:NO-inducible flavohemoprotein [Shouchella shacheensis]
MAQSLTPKQIALIKASVPVLAEHGVTITKRFYSYMFEAHPELLNMFNQANQQKSKQQQALANTLYAAAANIENLESLLPVVRQIAHKHRSLQVKPEHYPIVGEYLLGAIDEVLGEAATDELLEAWGVAYGIIAEIFISIEKEMYEEAASTSGGWEGYRRFVVKRKEQETDLITSFYLVPEDKGFLPSFSPGQYVTVKGYSTSDDYTHLRQYSLSDAPGKEHFRLSIKREGAGTLSNYMHGQVEEGAVVELTAPAGDFAADLQSDHPLVLISAGIGLTPLMSMAKGALETQLNRTVTFIHATNNEETHALRAEIEALADRHPNLSLDLRYTDSGEEAFLTQVDIDRLVSEVDQEFYMCGPVPFVQQMEGYLQRASVDPARIHFEVFTPLVPV